MVLRCDCGFRVMAECEADLVAGAQVHASETHGSDVAAAEVVVELLRSGHGSQAEEEGTIR